MDFEYRDPDYRRDFEVQFDPETGEPLYDLEIRFYNRMEKMFAAAAMDIETIAAERDAERAEKESLAAELLKEREARLAAEAGEVRYYDRSNQMKVDLDSRTTDRPCRQCGTVGHFQCRACGADFIMP